MIVQKHAVEKYVKTVKKMFIVFSVVALTAIMVCLLYAFMGYAAFWIIAPCALVFYLAVYAFYALRVSMGTAIGFETTDTVVYVRTKRKTYTYDVKRGCVGVKTTKRKFVCTFETQDSRDTFIFYRKAYFAKRYEDQFTADEIAAFYPKIAENG